MKQIIIVFATTMLAFAACNDSNTSGEAATKDTAIAPPSASAAPSQSTATPIQGIITGYLHLKNALAADNGKDAAIAGTEILNAMGKTDSTIFTVGQKKIYASVAGDVKENAEHINANADNIAHQREHFELLSTKVYDLVKAFGGGRQLYYEHCPMAFDGKGASWVSELEEIKNPYFGSEMLECGEVKERLK